MARTTAEVAAALDAVIGPDPSDLRALPMPEPSWVGALDQPHVPISVAWSPTLGYAGVDAEVRSICDRAVSVLADAGARIIEIDSVFPEDPVGIWMTLTSAYQARTVEHLRGTTAWQRLDPGLLAVIEIGQKVTGTQFVKAIDDCHRLNLRLIRLFHDCRLLVTPTVASVAPLLGEPGLINGQPDLNWVRFTYPFNLTRSPAGTVCVGFSSSGLPVGLQLIGPQHADLVVLRAMAAVEQAMQLDPVAPMAIS
jgi:aspartyl-tRNA(Asn)/glutamyl-tRNA(Gln) amidotransferase subunit A